MFVYTPEHENITDYIDPFFISRAEIRESDRGFFPDRESALADVAQERKDFLFRVLWFAVKFAYRFGIGRDYIDETISRIWDSIDTWDGNDD